MAGLRLDDGKGGYATNCFPVRSLAKQGEDGGAWLVAHAAEQRRRFKAVLCTKPARTFSQIRGERIKAERTRNNTGLPIQVDSSDENDDKALDGFFLMKHCCVEDPSDLCSVNISGQNLTEVKEDDFSLFDNVAYVNASENILPFHSFKHFPIIRELELSLNAVRNIQLNKEDFPHLEMLDLSYNYLSADDILNLGSLPNLRVLHLSGNNIKSIPTDISLPPSAEDSVEERPKGRFGQLEVLLLDDNQISDVNDFASLAGLRKLRHLNLAKNLIHTVPQLMLIEGRHVPTVLGSASTQGRRKKSGKTPRSAGRSRKSERKSSDKVKPEKVNSNSVFPGDVDAKGSLSNLNIEELNLEELDKKVTEVTEEAKNFINPTQPPIDTWLKEEEELDLPHVKEDTFETIDIHSQQTNVPPFPELIHINLSYNQVKDEESLLSVAAWPMLTELVIHDNPLTTENSGDPPLLKQFLQEKLGIRIQRKRSSAFVKPAVEIHAKPERKVQTQVPKVPKQDVEKIIAAIEAPLRHPALPPSSTTPATSPPPALDRRSPLPPILATPKEKTESNEEVYEGDAFFMTQVDEKETQLHGSEPVNEHKEKRKKKKEIKKFAEDEKRKYKGYEELMDTDDEVLEGEELPKTQDVQGNVRALKYTLEHPLVFRDHEVRLDKQQTPYEPLTKNKVRRDVGPASCECVLARLPQFPFENKYEIKVKKKTVKKVLAGNTKRCQAAEFLDTVKNRQTIVEEELSKVLSGKHKQGEDFKHADQLLGQVQNKYNAVRSASMNNSNVMSKKAKAILKDTVTYTENLTDK